MSTTRYLCITSSVMVSQNITLQSLNKHNHRNKYITSSKETKSCQLQGTYASLLQSWFHKTLHYNLPTNITTRWFHKTSHYNLSTNVITETSILHQLKKQNHVDYKVLTHHLSCHGFAKHYITVSQQTKYQKQVQYIISRNIIMSTTIYLCITSPVMVSQNITLQCPNKHNNGNKYGTSS